MKKNVFQFLLVFVLLVGMTGSVWAQALSYNFNKKVMLGSSVDLPPNTSLLQVLQLFPELLQRPNENLIDNYEIKIEGLSVGDSKDAILSQVMLQDIEKIELEDSPISNYENNGQGGSINVLLKSLPSGTSGNAFAMAGYPYDFVPGFSLNNKSRKWSFRSFITGEVYSSETKTPLHYTNLTGNRIFGFVSDKNQTQGNDLLHQMARLYAKYRPDSLNLFNFSVSELFNRRLTSTSLVEVNNGDDSSLAPTASQNSTKGYEILARCEYKHFFSVKSVLTFEAVYNYSPLLTKLVDADTFSKYSDNDTQSHSISGKLEYDQPVEWGKQSLKSAARGNVHFVPGVKYNYTYSYADGTTADGFFRMDRSTSVNSLFLSPYLQLKSTLGPVSLMLNAEYQMYFYRITGNAIEGFALNEEQEHKSTQKNFVGNFIAVWNINKEHSLRLFADRRLKRPTEAQFFPYLFYSVTDDQYQKGNALLKPMTMDCISLEYILDKQVGVSRWQFSLGGKFTHTSDNIIAGQDSVKLSKSSRPTGYITYYNAQNDRIWNAYSMLQWSYKWFTLTANANYFNRYTAATDIRHSYYNVSVIPQFNLPGEWNISARYIHNAKIIVNDVSTVPSIDFADFMVSKTWNHFTAYVHVSLCFNKKYTVNKLEYNGKIQVTSTTTPYDNSYYAGIRYNF